MTKKIFFCTITVFILCVIVLWWMFYILFNIKTTSIEVNFINTKKIDNLMKNKKIKYHIPKFMLELYEKNKGNKGVDVVRSLIPKQADSFVDNEGFRRFSDSHLLIFELPTADKDENFISAELKILTIVNTSMNFDKIERILEIASFQTPNNVKCIQQLRISQNNNTWISFNVTEVVGKALLNDRNLKILITITSLMPKLDNFDLKLSLMPLVDDLEHDYPILILSYISNDGKFGKIRKKRNLEEEYEEETNNIWDDTKYFRNHLKKIRNSCRRRPLYVNFAEIEYDLWIVQPSGYEAYQCQGRCYYPVAEHLNPTKHAILQALVHSVAPSRATRSCCVPTRLDSISVLYVDGNGVLTYRYAYKDMVVAECGCR